MAFGLLGMFVKCGRVTVFQGRANKSLAGRDSRPALALKIKTLSRYLAVSLSRCLAISLSRYLAISLSRCLAVSLSHDLAVALSRCHDPREECGRSMVVAT